MKIATKHLLALSSMLATGLSATAQDGPKTTIVDLENYDRTVYVSTTGSDESGAGTKSSPWSSVARALEAISVGDKTAVLVAEGSYETNELRMASGVDIFGGFDTDDWSRDIWTNRTVLDGAGKGRVVLGADQATLDGFEIRGGVIQGRGAGILADGTSPIITNNILTDNQTLAPKDWNPEYWHERANDGGAFYCGNGGEPVLRDNLVVGNKTVNGRGAGLAFDFRCNGEVVGNVIMNNVAGLDDPMRSSDGGGISVFDWSAPRIENNVVLNNIALNKNDAGGIFLNLWGKSDVINNLIVGNDAGDDAGGLFLGGQEHRYGGTPLDPMPSADDYYVKVIGNRFHGNTNSSRNSGAARITMETRGVIKGNIAALNPGFYIQRTEGQIVNNTILEDFIFIETKESLKPSYFAGNVVWGAVDYDTNATVTGNLFRDGFEGDNKTGSPTFRDDVLTLKVLSAAWSKKDFVTKVLLANAVDPSDLKGRVIRAGDKWSVVRDVTGNSLTLWGDLSAATSLTVISRYEQTVSSAGIGMGADAATLKKKTEWQPKRINKMVELLENGQPIYYASAYGGYNKGLEMGGTWADYIVYNMEHNPLDFALLRGFMKGLVDAGPTPSGHRTPAVIVVLPLLGLSDTTVEAGGWMVEQALAQGVHGVHLARAQDPKAVKRFVQSARYPIHKKGLDVTGTGLRGWGSHKFAAWVWGVSEQEYLRKADVWPLNPEGEIMLGVKIEDQTALANAEVTLAVPGLAFAEHGPRDMHLSYGYTHGRADPPIEAEVEAAGVKVLDLTKRNGLYFLDNVLPDNVSSQLDRGVMIGAGRREDAAATGRAHTKRKMPW